MAVTFDLPADIEESLRHELGDLAAAAKEAALIELYRQRRLSARDLGRALGLARTDLDAVLKKHGVVEDLPTDAEHIAALERLRSAANP